MDETEFPINSSIHYEVEMYTCPICSYVSVFPEACPGCHRQLISIKEPDPANPKDQAAETRVPLDMWPDVASAYGALGMLEGALKYGRKNYTDAPVKAMVYAGAARRHLAKWISGEECDQETKVPHLASVLCSIAIILDAEHNGTLIDNRPKDKKPISELFKSFTHIIENLHDLHGTDTRLLTERGDSPKIDS